MKRIFILPVVISLFIFSCKSKTATKETANDITAKDTSREITPGHDTAETITIGIDSVLHQLTNEILTAIKSRNYIALGKFIDPVVGVRFSPYAYIDTIHDVVLSKEKFIEKAAKPTQGKILWGEIDPTSEPIRMTLDEYMKAFVYDVDFIKPETFKVNTFIGFGNTQNNLQSVYSGCNFTESHFSGFEKKYEGMDWRSLRLVFRLREGTHYLVGIIHDQWTT